MIIHCDGLAEPNPGHATWAFVAFEDASLLKMHTEKYGYLGEKVTNNVAEYTAVLKALEFVNERKLEGVKIVTDSQLVVKQISGEWSCNKDNLREMRDRGQEFLINSAGVTLGWIPGGDNEADAFTRIAFEEATGRPATPRNQWKFKKRGK